MLAVHINTNMGYPRISLVRAVSVHIVFLSKLYEINNTKFVLIQFLQAMVHIWCQYLCHCWIVHC